MKRIEVIEEEIVEPARTAPAEAEAYSAALLTAAWPAPVEIPTGEPRRIIGLACEPVRRGRPPAIRH